MKRLLWILTAILALSSVGYAVDATKAVAQIDNWTAIAGDTSIKSSAITLTDDIQSVLHIDAASTSTNAVTANENLLVFVWIKSGATDEFWHLFVQVSHSGTTAATQALAAASGPAQANPDRVELAATANFDAQGGVYFLKDATLSESEIVCGLDATSNDYLQCMTNLVRDHDTGDALFNQVSQWNIAIPGPVTAAMVTFHNRDDDATYAARIRISELTDME